MTDAQLAMVHRLPAARLVERVPHVAQMADGKRVIHIGFVDTGFQSMQEQAGTWLHGHLADRAKSLVGIDLDDEGVAEARRRGFEAHQADCRDLEALAELHLEPAELVIAGELIEHLDDPGSFLDAMHTLVAPGGRLVLTTPNASGILNGAAALAGAEINHPDHVILFSWRTLTNLLSRHGWEHQSTATFVPQVKQASGRGVGQWALGLGGRIVLALERWIGRLLGAVRGRRADRGMPIVGRRTARPAYDSVTVPPSGVGHHLRVRRRSQLDRPVGPVGHRGRRWPVGGSEERLQDGVVEPDGEDRLLAFDRCTG